MMERVLRTGQVASTGLTVLVSEKRSASQAGSAGRKRPKRAARPPRLFLVFPSQPFTHNQPPPTQPAPTPHPGFRAPRPPREGPRIHHRRRAHLLARRGDERDDHHGGNHYLLQLEPGARLVAQLPAIHSPQRPRRAPAARPPRGAAAAPTGSLGPSRAAGPPGSAAANACHNSFAPPHQVLSAATQLPCDFYVLLDSAGNPNLNSSALMAEGAALPEVDRFTFILGPEGATDVGWGALGGSSDNVTVACGVRAPAAAHPARASVAADEPLLADEPRLSASPRPRPFP